MNLPENLPIIVFFLLFPAISIAQTMNTTSFQFGPFNSSYYNTFAVEDPATISNKALQITPDSASANFSLQHRSGRVLLRQSFKLWEGEKGSKKEKIASFNSTFHINIFRFNNTIPGEGLAFIIAPDLNLPPGSNGQYLGLTNSTTDGSSTNHLIGIELDTFKQDFDPDNNHMGLDLNSIRSIKTVSLSELGIDIAPVNPKNYTVWVQYDATIKFLEVYMDQEGEPKPRWPVLNATVNIRDYVKQYSYFGFAASTGDKFQLNCVLGWNLTVEKLPEEDKDDDKTTVRIAVGVGVTVVVLMVLFGVGYLGYHLHKRKVENEEKSRILLGALNSLPGVPREFSYKDLKKATNDFDEKMKLGQGGFGVVYKGVLPKEKMEIAVKMFSRGKIESKDDFLAELTIINRLRHKNLVRLLGWCHENEKLILVYDYMPNGSLDNHLFGGTEGTLSWDHRFKIVGGVASALNYLHKEYDQKVVHRDLKASNIMLDANFSPRLGDFGLARALDNEMTSYIDVHNKGILGTMGYIAPECFHTGKATTESDIYGFGAVVLEVVSGQRPWTKIEEFGSLVDWVWMLYGEGRILEAVDKRLEGDFVVDEAKTLLVIGLACCHPRPEERLQTEVVIQIMLGSLPVPNLPPFRPAFMWPSTGGIVISMPVSLSSSSSYFGGSSSDRSAQNMSQEGYVGHTHHMSTGTNSN